MKLHFESDLPYQAAAIEAVCDLFRGQEVCRSEFTVTMQALSTRPLVPELESGELLPGTVPQQMTLEGVQETDQGGIGNRLTLLDDEIADNLVSIQVRNGLPPSGKLSADFTVEMETGTGKTYVYLRTVFELNRRYGFTKFVVVVPSVAIKEAVNKTLEITREHFEALYPSAKGYEFFQYDSAKLGQVRNYATSPNIQIMVITVGAINKFGDETEAAVEESDESKRREKSKNVMYRASEKTGGEKPIDLVRATKPIIIVDEPQSVDGGIDGGGKKALDRMGPLGTLRYSATHAEKHNMVYRLDGVDAYEQKLVKQIEVAAATVQGANNRAYVKLLAVSSKRGVISAVIEVDRENSAGVVRRDSITVQDGFDLEQEPGRALYPDVRIGEIRTAKSDQFMELKVPGSEVFLRPGDAWGDVDATAIQREMIRRTIKEHLDKEKRLRPLGVKVLSLFFIDAVDKYRQYDAEGKPVKGEYAAIFVEEYKRWARHPDYLSLFGEIDLNTAADEVHNGYFSIDKKKVGGKSVEGFKDTSGVTKADDDTYNLIMRDKEKLLGFESPLKLDAAPLPLEIPADAKDETVYLAAPLRRAGADEADLAGDDAAGLTRYRVSDTSITDNNTGADTAALVQLGELRLRIMLKRDVTDAYACVGVLRVRERRADNQVLLDSAYIAPTLAVGDSAPLAAYLGEIEGLLHQRGEAIAARLSSPGRGGVAEIADFLLLQTVNRYEPEFAHLRQISALHPERFYAIGLLLAGELCTFTRDQRRPPAYPEYNHDEPARCFTPLMLDLRRSLSMVMEQTAIPIELQDRKYGVRVAIVPDAELLRSAGFVLAVNAQMPAEVLPGWMVWRPSAPAPVTLGADGQVVMPASPEMELKYGVRFTQVAVIADGGMVDLRYQVRDPDKAVALMSMSMAEAYSNATAPKLIVEQDGTRIENSEVMSMKQIPEAYSMQFVLFANPRGVLKPGMLVTIVVGSLRLTHVPVQ